MASLLDEFGDDATFLIVYVRESNPNTHMFPDIDRPQTFAERTALARRLHDEFYPGFTMLVDDLDNTIYESYGRPRTATFLIDTDGIVRFKAAWAPPAEVRRALERVLHGDRRGREGVTASAAGRETATAHLDIEGMLCQGCVIAVRNALEAAPGVIRADVDLSRARATVEYKPSETSPADLAAAVTDTGFGARRRGNEH